MKKKESVVAEVSPQSTVTTRVKKNKSKNEWQSSQVSPADIAGNVVGGVSLQHWGTHR
jgi:hypothetical protein